MLEIAESWNRVWGGWANWVGGWRIEWGSAGEWFGAVATLLAVIVALAIPAADRIERQRRDVDEARAETIRRYRDQRTRVEPVRFEIQGYRLVKSDLPVIADPLSEPERFEPLALRVKIYNDSDFPINSCHIQLGWVVPEGEKVPKGIGSAGLNSGGRLAVRRTEVESYLGPRCESVVKIDEGVDLNEYQIYLDFRDASMRRWKIDPNGHLIRVYENGVMPDVSDEYFEEEMKHPSFMAEGEKREQGLYSLHTGKTEEEALRDRETRARRRPGNKWRDAWRKSAPDSDNGPA